MLIMKRSSHPSLVTRPSQPNNRLLIIKSQFTNYPVHSTTNRQYTDFHQGTHHHNMIELLKRAAGTLKTSAHTQADRPKMKRLTVSTSPPTKTKAAYYQYQYYDNWIHPACYTSTI